MSDRALLRRSTRLATLCALQQLAAEAALAAAQHADETAQRDVDRARAASLGTLRLWDDHLARAFDPTVLENLHGALRADAARLDAAQRTKRAAYAVTTESEAALALHQARLKAIHRTLKPLRRRLARKREESVL